MTVSREEMLALADALEVQLHSHSPLFLTGKTVSEIIAALRSQGGNIEPKLLTDGDLILCLEELRSRDIAAQAASGELRHDGDIQRCLETIEGAYDFECKAGPLKNCGEWKYLKRLLASQAPSEAHSPPGSNDPLEGLAERLDRLCLTSTEDGRRFVLATESAKNIVEIVRVWIGRTAALSREENEPGYTQYTGYRP